jgi:hypothetical protein
MSTTLDKNCPCPSPEIISVPGSQGATGAAGSNGTNGVNSFTVTTANLTIPAVNSTVQIGVANVSWMAIGQSLFLSDGTNLAHFLVTAIQASPPAVTLRNKGDNGDSAPTVVIAAGASVTPTGVQGSAGFTVLATQSAATGGSQAVTATPAQALASTLTLVGSAGKTYLLRARLRLDYVGATFAANQTVTLTIRRTNNTAANLASTTLQTAVVTTVTYGFGEITCDVPYSTAGVSDVIQPFISLSVIPSAGSFNVVEASLTALELT